MNEGKKSPPTLVEHKDDNSGSEGQERFVGSIAACLSYFYTFPESSVSPVPERVLDQMHFWADCEVTLSILVLSFYEDRENRFPLAFNGWGEGGE